MECLWAQVRKLRTDEWQERHIYRPYLAFDSILSEALQHNLPAILPPPHTPTTQYPLPWVVFRMFDYTDCPEVHSHFSSNLKCQYVYEFSVCNCFTLI